MVKNKNCFTDFESLIALQQDSSTEMGGVLHSKIFAFDIISHVSSQMKKKLSTKIIESSSKINAPTDESTAVLSVLVTNKLKSNFKNLALIAMRGASVNFLLDLVVDWQLSLLLIAKAQFWTVTNEFFHQ